MHQPLINCYDKCCLACHCLKETSCPFQSLQSFSILSVCSNWLTRQHAIKLNYFMQIRITANLSQSKLYSMNTKNKVYLHKGFSNAVLVIHFIARYTYQCKLIPNSILLKCGCGIVLYMWLFCYIITVFVHIIFCTYHIVENISRIKHWQIQPFRLFRKEKFGEWLMDINNAMHLREKTLVICQPYAKFTNVFSYQRWCAY